MKAKLAKKRTSLSFPKISLRVLLNDHHDVMRCKNRRCGNLDVSPRRDRTRFRPSIAHRKSRTEFAILRFYRDSIGSFLNVEKKKKKNIATGTRIARFCFLIKKKINFSLCPRRERGKCVSQYIIFISWKCITIR